MTVSYTLLEKITVGAATASSVTFSGIPQTGYTDLVVKASVRDTVASIANAGMRVFFNGSSTSYTRRTIYGNGTNAFSDNENPASWIRIGQQPGANSTANTFSNDEIYIPNYLSSNYKSLSADAVGENNATEAYAVLTAGLWSNTAAITSIMLQSNSSAWALGSTFYLYGVAKLGTTPAIVPYATGGDTIMTDGTYWYHTFISSGTFTPAKAITCDYLVVAGGGGAGGWLGGGGGGGGLRSTVTATGGGGSLESALSLASSTGYTVTVGAGGAGGPYSTPPTGTNGSNSVFSTITSTGGGSGGGGGGVPSQNGVAGGSGGGGGGALSAKTGGAGTVNQGFAGGNTFAIDYAAAGGGGAGAVGGNTSNTGNGANTGAGGAGGAGVATSITGSSVTYAGGGGGHGYSGGGAGGTGGGGAGGTGGPSTGSAGTTNLGGGGGGGVNTTGGNGGSGIVIVRYAV